MILKGNQRSGAKQLAVHLLRTDENEHVEVHEIRGFLADDLTGALREAYAVSRGTKCKQFLFSLSLSPPETENVPIAAFETAIENIEEKLGLVGQPRALVFHEKQGRRHAHCVWSRIDADAMRAINLPHFKLKLRDVSRQLYIEHGWRMPHGLVESADRDPLNFTRAEWQQAKRTDQDPRLLKKAFQDCWAMSDSSKAFEQALASRGLYLARGDRRGFVAVDLRGEVYAIAKWVGVRSKEVKSKLGAEDGLPSVAEAQSRVAELMTDVFRHHLVEAEAAFQIRWAPLEIKRARLVQAHKEARASLDVLQETRRSAETRTRASRLPHGLRAVWGWLTGRTARIRRANELEAEAALQLDRAQRQMLIECQLEERLKLQAEIHQARQVHARETAFLHRYIAPFHRLPDVEINARHAPGHTGHNRHRPKPSM